MVKLAFLDHRDKWIKTGCKCFGCERLRAKKDPKVVSVNGFVASKQRKQVEGGYRPKKGILKKLIVKPKGESASGNTSLIADREGPCYKRHLDRKVDNLRGLPLKKPRHQAEVWDNGEVIHRPGAGRGKLLPFLNQLSLDTDASDDSSVDVSDNFSHKVSSSLPKGLHSVTSPESLGADRPVVKLDYWSVKFREINILYRVGEDLMPPALMTSSGLRISYRNDMRNLKKGALTDKNETRLQASSAYCGLLENFPIMTAEQAEVYHHPSTLALEFLDNKIPRTPLRRHAWKSKANKAFDDWAACYDNICFSFNFKGYVEVLRQEALLRASNGKDSVVSRNSHDEPSFAHRFLVSTKMRGPDEHPPLDTATIIKSKDSTSQDVQKTQG